MINQEWINIDLITDDAFGFIYKITDLTTGLLYIGSKQLYHTRKVKLSKKKKKLLNTRKIYEYVQRYSGWKEYTGSSIDLNEEIKKDIHIFKKEIIMIVFNKKQIKYYETKYQFVYEVLEKQSFNQNILGKYYRSDLI